MVVSSCYNSGTGACLRTKNIITNAQTSLFNTERMNGCSAPQRTKVAASSHPSVGVVTRRRYTEGTMSYNLTPSAAASSTSRATLTTLAHARFSARSGLSCVSTMGLRLSLWETCRHWWRIAPRASACANCEAARGCAGGARRSTRNELNRTCWRPGRPRQDAISVATRRSRASDDGAHPSRT